MRKLLLAQLEQLDVGFYDFTGRGASRINGLGGAHA